MHIKPPLTIFNAHAPTKVAFNFTYPFQFPSEICIRRVFIFASLFVLATLAFVAVMTWTIVSSEEKEEGNEKLKNQG